MINLYEITIDSSKIDKDLTDFPVLITLSSDTHTTSVFDDLGSYSNRKKMRITDSNDNQLYVEIEDWDHGNQKAHLWTKVPTIASGTDTILYLYYDVTYADNTTYVGDTTSTPAQNVWDSYFELVMHMAQNPGNGAVGDIKDSTSNTNHGQPLNMEPGDLVDTTVGKALDFDGTNECVSVPDHTSLSFGNGATDESMTVEIFANFDDVTDCSLFGKSTNANREYLMYGTSSDLLEFILYDDVAANRETCRTTGTITSYQGLYTHFAARYDGRGGGSAYDGMDILIGGVNQAASDQSSGSYVAMNNQSTVAFTIARYDTSLTEYADGKISETRVSRTDRSNAWLKATISTLNDDLISFKRIIYNSKCFQTTTGEFYYSIGSNLNAVYSTTSDWVTPDYVYDDTILLDSGNINDIHVTEGTSIYGGDNVIFLATSNGAHIIEERKGDEANSRTKRYFLK